MEQLVAYMGIALACALAGIGSAVGVGIAAQASTGVMSVDPGKFGKLLLLSALPGTQGIYGFVIAFLLLGKVTPGMDMSTAWQVFTAGLPIALAGLLSGIHQGKVCAGGAMMTAKQPNDSAKSLILAVFVEFYAILGFLVSFLMLQGIGG
ncbi:MAG: V-type ATP synthase subunit K [Candidatus Fermentibacteraceae bacterium]|nr:V-type ATP synthase subunit K [Candidatus Fermentibacteraceae bacterium]MBN2609198.1 V-type ATP synthase subunit K [Candidatus Fermentibacteraceae bacterium]